MKTKFSLFGNLKNNLRTLEEIDQCIKISLGPIGKTAIFFNQKKELKFLTSGSLLIRALEFPTTSSMILLKLIEQASVKTHQISGDGSTTTLLFVCQLLQTSFRFFGNGYNTIFLSNGLKKISYFFSEKVLEFAIPISNVSQLIGVLRTSLGRKINSDVSNLLYESINQIGRDGLLIVEEKIGPGNEVEVVQGIELDRGFASSYFVNDVKNFEVVYDNPYLLIASNPIQSINQLREVIEYTKSRNRPLVIIAEEINKDVISTLVLNTIQKKLKVVVIKYSSIKFLKNGFLDDLAILTYSNYFVPTQKDAVAPPLTPEDLGQVEKIIIKKEKTTFFLSKFSKVIAKRRINELTRDLITSETDVEKNTLRTRIARLSGNIAKVRIGTSNQYQIEEERQKIESAITTIKSSLEEGILPGGGTFYLMLANELKQWGYTNLIGEEIFSMQLLLETLVRPFSTLYQNSNTKITHGILLEKISEAGYPYGYDVVEQKICHTINYGLVDSAKSIRANLWNSLTLVSTILTSD